MNDRAEIEEMKWALERQLGWIQSADTKLTILVPVPTAMLGVLSTYVERIPDMTLTVLVPFLVATCLLAAALFLAAVSVVPRTDGPASSSVFLGKIAQMAAPQYRAMVTARSEADYLSDLSDQVHINAEIAAQKHGLIRKAMYCLFIAIAPWLATLYFG
jgi:hypothetical protein